jgi:hypothetical protein
MKRILLTFSLMTILLGVNAQINDSINNIYYHAVKEYLTINKRMKQNDTIVILNKYGLSLPTNLHDIKIISVNDDYEIIKYYSNKFSFEIYPSKWKLFYSEVKILLSYVEDKGLTIEGMVYFHFRRKIFSKQFYLIKKIEYGV